MKTVNPFLLPSLVAALLAGCSTAPTTVPTAAPVVVAPSVALETVLSGSRWAATELVDSSSATPVPAPKLVFIGLKEVNGMGGCNTFSSSVEVAGDRLVMGPRNTTRKLCLGSPMITEGKFFMALENARKARIVDGQLELMSEGGSPLLRLTRSE